MVFVALGLAGTTAAGHPVDKPAPTLAPALVLGENSPIDGSSHTEDTVLYAQSSEIDLPGSIRLSTARFKGAPSSTARKYYRIGARAYEKNDLETAENAFNSALLAHSRELIPDIVLYLAKIAEQNGETNKAFLYAFVYLQLYQPNEPIIETLEDPNLEFRK